MKKTVIWLISILLSVLSSVLVFAEQTTEIRASSEAGNTGDTVNVSVDISGNTGLAGWLLEITWDESALNLVGNVKAGEAFSGGTLLPKQEAGKLRVFWYDLTEQSNDGQMLSLQFKIADTANAGDYEIQIKPSEENTIDEEGNPVAVTALSGSIHIDKKVENAADHMQTSTTKPDTPENGVAETQPAENGSTDPTGTDKTTASTDASEGSSNETVRTNDSTTQDEKITPNSDTDEAHSESETIIVVAIVLLLGLVVVIVLIRKRRRS